jgi:hypothetical protein
MGNANKTVTTTDRVIFTNTVFTATRTLTLPTAASFPTGVPLWIVDAKPAITASFFLVLARQSGDTIQGVAANLTYKNPGLTICLMSDGGTNWVIVDALDANATLQTGSGSPTGTTSGTGVMCGLGSLISSVITPVISGNILAFVNGALNNNTAGGGAQAQIRWGTGSVPANGAALTGTAVGVNAQRAGAAWGSNQTCPYSVNALITGLTLGTQIWIDIGQSAVVGGTMNLTASVTAMEMA